jgi:hypothetical protein
MRKPVTRTSNRPMNCTLQLKTGKLGAVCVAGRMVNRVQWVAQVLDLADFADTVGDPSFAHFAKDGYHERRQRSYATRTRNEIFVHPSSTNSTVLLPLRDPDLSSLRRPPSPLDCYLSWMYLYSVTCITFPVLLGISPVFSPCIPRVQSARRFPVYWGLFSGMIAPGKGGLTPSITSFIHLNNSKNPGR